MQSYCKEEMGNTEMKPNLKKIELCLTYRCNVKCANCSNLCTQAPTDGTMDLTVKDVEAFIEQSVAANHQWDLITLHGGEPLLNNSIVPICALLKRYHDIYNHSVRISLLSNGSTQSIVSRVRRMCSEFGMEPGVSEKVKSNRRGDGTPIPYVPVNISPEDAGIPWTRGCFQTTDCGICLNYAGYWPCSPMAAAARVFGYQPMAKSVQELTEDVLAAGFDIHCRYCGFAGALDRVIEQKTSTTWKKAIEKYYA